MLTWVASKQILQLPFLQRRRQRHQCSEKSTKHSWLRNIKNLFLMVVWRAQQCVGTEKRAEVFNPVFNYDTSAHWPDTKPRDFCAYAGALCAHVGPSFSHQSTEFRKKVLGGLNETFLLFSFVSVHAKGRRECPRRVCFVPDLCFSNTQIWITGWDHSP